MIIINHETYVSFEIAKLLKEAGFDWVEHHYYNIEEGHDYVEHVGVLPTNWNDIDGRLSAPTLAVVQKWLREVKHEYIEVHPIVNKWYYSIHRPNFGHYYRDKQFETYEEAQETGIKKILELILEKKNKTVTI